MQKPALLLLLLFILPSVAIGDIDAEKLFMGNGLFPLKQVQKKVALATRSPKLTPLKREPIAELQPVLKQTTPPEKKKEARFVVMGELVLDRMNNIYWSKNANIYNRPLKAKELPLLLETLNGLSYLGQKQWRFPTDNELESLSSFAYKNGFNIKGKPAAESLNSAGFQNFQQHFYYYSFQKASTTSQANSEFRGHRHNFSDIPYEELEKSTKQWVAYLIPVCDVSK